MWLRKSTFPSFRGLSDFKNEKIAAESKPCLMFSGAAFEKNEEMQRLKSLLIDFFRCVFFHVERHASMQVFG